MKRRTHPNGLPIRFITGTTMALAAILFLLPLPINAQQHTLKPLPNPVIGSACGLDVMLVLDESGSIRDAQAIGHVEEATLSFLDALANTGSRVALTEFNSTARVVLAHTPVTAGADGTVETVFRPYLSNDFDPPESPYWYTNWNDAMKQISLVNELQRSQLVVFVTDGDPTAYNLEHPGEAKPTTIDDVVINTISTGHALTQTVEYANIVKNQGSRVVAIGVGNALVSQKSQERLKTIAGPNLLASTSIIDAEELSQILAADVLLVQDFAELKNALRSLALSLCGSSLTVTKEVNLQDGVGYQPAQGWVYSGRVALDVAQHNDYRWELPKPGAQAGESVSSITNQHGSLTFQWSPNQKAGATITVNEAERPGYRLRDTNCTVRSLLNPDPQTLPITLSGLTIEANLDPTEVATCIVRSDLIVGSVMVDAQPPYQLRRIGEKADFDFTVRNLSDESLKELSIDSSHCTAVHFQDGDTNNDAILQMNEEWRYRCQSAPVQSDFVNIVQVTAKDTADRAVEPAFGQNIVDAMNPVVGLHVSPQRQYAAVGSDARFTFDVTNPGDVDLYDIRISSEQCDDISYIEGDENLDRVLQTGERWQYDCQVVNVQNEMTVTAFADGEDPNGAAIPPASDNGIIEIHVDNVCNVGGFQGELQRTKIFGAGMGDRYESMIPVTVSLPDQGRLIGLEAQMAGRWRGALPYRVTFDSGLETVVMTHQTTINEERDNYRLFTYETSMQPYGDVTFAVDDQVVRNWRTPRGAILYADYQSRSEYFEVVRQINKQAYWGWGKIAHTETVAIPPLGSARTIYLTAVLIDNDPDDRPLVFRAKAGGVQTELSDNGPTHGPNLSIYYLKLPHVPAGTSQVELIMESPQGIGDSLEWAGYSLSFSCTPDTDDDGVPDAGEDLNGDGVYTNDDSDQDGTPNYLDRDDDGDEILTEDEDYNGNLDPEDDDLDEDGIPDYLDPDEFTVSISEPAPETTGANLTLSTVALSGPESIAGTRAEFSVVVRNTGPHAAEHVEILNTIPDFTNLRSATIVRDADESQTQVDDAAVCASLPDLDSMVACSVGTVASGDVIEIDVVVDIDPALADGHVISNHAEVTSSTMDPELSNNHASADVTVLSQSALALDSSVTNSSPAFGEEVTYSISIHNQGPSVARDVVLHQALPPEMSFVRSSIACELAEDELGLNYACPLGEIAGAAATPSFDLAAGQILTVDITAQVDEVVSCGPIWESLAWVQAKHMDGHSFAESSVSAGCQADLRIHQFGNATGFLDPGIPVTLTVLVENMGPDVAQNATVDLSIKMMSADGNANVTPAFDILSVNSDPFGDRDFARCNVLTALNIQNGRKELHCELDDEFEQLDLEIGGGRWLIEIAFHSATGGFLTTQATVTTATVDPIAENNSVTSESDPAIFASIQPPLDRDEDGIPDYRDLDWDNDGLPNAVEGDVDTDNDGTPDLLDSDSDGDGIADRFEGDVDTDGDNEPDYRDADSDGDGIPDVVEGTHPMQKRDSGSDDQANSNPTGEIVDVDNDGIPDFRDQDSDNDFIPDHIESSTDTDGDGVPNYRDSDSDGDGAADLHEGTLDSNQNGVPDYVDSTVQTNGGIRTSLKPKIYMPFTTQ